MSLFINKLLVWMAFIFVCTLVRDASSIQCKDESGKNVDWLVMYKLPKDNGHQTAGDVIHEGAGYAYMTSSNYKKGWIVSDKSVEDKKSIPGRILAPLYGKRDKGLMYILYNDEFPDGNTSMSSGHTKGVVAFEKDEGFWLVHSVPKFPPSTETDEYGYPSSGKRNGQSFLCISLKTSEGAEVVANQLLFNHPNIYSSNIPTWAKGKYEVFKMASEENHIRDPPYFHTAQIKSIDGVSFTSFAKYTKFQKDLYADLVAPSLKQDLMVETWPNGPGKMNSSCEGPFMVENVDEIDFGKWIDGFDFTTHRDHSKWAISFQSTLSASSMSKVVCIGDINRMTTQKKRAGGTVCFENEYVWKAYSGLVKNIESCPITK